MDMTNKGAREEILRLFRQREEEFVSGEELSQSLGVSRTAVWKQIKLLRDLGYVIEAVPSRGYRLATAPDTLIPAEIQSGLGTRLIGREVVYFEETDSTNVRAHELGESAAPDGTVVIAEHQVAGKGRRGRQWVSPPGVNLYTSVLLRPDIFPRFATQLTFVSAVAVARAIEDVTDLKPRVKWPNDILIGGKKAAGLLNEMSAETESINYVILGIGVNLNMSSGQFPSDLRYPATSVALEQGAPVSRLDFARALLRRLDHYYLLFLEQGFSPVISDWENLCDLMGMTVEVDCQDRIIRGRAEGIDEDGALLLRLPDGMRERVLAGDVRPLQAGKE
jgi:BirA family biotin operon repressor/biotin-[acetyl-CoA-carboxylase] ligase